MQRGCSNRPHLLPRWCVTERRQGQGCAWRRRRRQSSATTGCGQGRYGCCRRCRRRCPPAAGTKSAGTGGTDAGSADDSRGAGQYRQPAATPGGGVPGAQPGGADRPTACTGTGKATCYKAPKEEPAEKPKEQPPDEKTANKSKAEASADTPEVPSPTIAARRSLRNPGGQAAMPRGRSPIRRWEVPPSGCSVGHRPAQNGGAPPAQNGGLARTSSPGQGQRGCRCWADGRRQRERRSRRRRAGGSWRLGPRNVDAAVGQAEGQRTGAVAAYMASAQRSRWRAMTRARSTAPRASRHARRRAAPT